MVLTGLLRIYTEPYYENASGANFENLEENVRYKNGQVRSHGRGQFGSRIKSHFAGLSPYWEDVNNRRSFRMDSNNIFSTTPTEFLVPKPLLESAPASSYPLGNDTVSQTQSSVTSKIANFMKKSTRSEGFSSYNQKDVAGIQSSALVFGGVAGANVPNTEEYDGTTWTSSGNMNIARRYLAGCGTQTLALGFGGAFPLTASTEEYNGTSWTVGGNLVTARRSLGGAGTQTAGLAFGGITTAVTAATEEYTSGLQTRVIKVS
jgi:hypothetical protein